MKAAVVMQAGQGPVYADFAEPEAAAGEARIHVAAAALSHLVKARAAGVHYSASGRFPFVAGVDGVGRLDDGRRVYFFLPRAPFGAMAERTVAALSQCLPLADGLDDVTAAALANPGMSSWAALCERAKLKPGETVLVNGATGTSGRLAIAIARHLGAGKVIATGRNAAALADLGADATIPVVEDDAALEDAFGAQFAGGIDVVLDYIYGRSARSLLIAAARRAPEGVPIRFVQIGALAGPEIALPAAVLRSSSLVLMGSGLGSVPQEKLIAGIRAMFQAATAEGFRVATKAVPLSGVEQAWAESDSRQRTVFIV